MFAVILVILVGPPVVTRSLLARALSSHSVELKHMRIIISSPITDDVKDRSNPSRLPRIAQEDSPVSIDSLLLMVLCVSVSALPPLLPIYETRLSLLVCTWRSPLVTYHASPWLFCKISHEWVWCPWSYFVLHAIHTAFVR